ncbi:uncharacterized protein LOC142592736 isoform X2 [Dermacentor variabilis]|uniref:uncharacterized protein LOC142592736 isoform X2 n=1 Tax=Dermacentor variabilis TaxID=34621 RepID=UPI003F5C81F4
MDSACGNHTMEAEVIHDGTPRFLRSAGLPHDDYLPEGNQSGNPIDASWDCYNIKRDANHNDNWVSPQKPYSDVCACGIRSCYLEQNEITFFTRDPVSENISHLSEQLHYGPERFRPGASRPTTPYQDIAPILPEHNYALNPEKLRRAWSLFTKRNFSSWQLSSPPFIHSLETRDACFPSRLSTDSPPIWAPITHDPESNDLTSLVHTGQHWSDRRQHDFHDWPTSQVGTRHTNVAPYGLLDTRERYQTLETTPFGCDKDLEEQGGVRSTPAIEGFLPSNVELGQEPEVILPDISDRDGQSWHLRHIKTESDSVGSSPTPEWYRCLIKSAPTTEELLRRHEELGQEPEAILPYISDDGDHNRQLRQIKNEPVSDDPSPALAEPRQPECPPVDNEASAGAADDAQSQQREKLFGCPWCETMFRAKRSLVVHMRRHTGERPFKCHLCPTAFMSQQGLKGHLLRHSNARPWKCDICSKGYIKKHFLNVHKRLQHQGAGLFKCDLCPQVFVVSASLQVHRRAHDEDKPSQCHVCLAQFPDRSTLRKHALAKHSDRPFMCDLCGKTFSMRAALKNHRYVHVSSRGCARRWRSSPPPPPELTTPCAVQLCKVEPADDACVEQSPPVTGASPV